MRLTTSTARSGFDILTNVEFNINLVKNLSVFRISYSFTKVIFLFGQRSKLSLKYPLNFLY